MKFLGFLDQSKEIGIISRRLERVEAMVGTLSTAAYAVDGAATAVTASAAIMHTEANKISAVLQGERISAKMMADMTDSMEYLISAIRVMREFQDISQDLKRANAGVDRLLEVIRR